MKHLPVEFVVDELADGDIPEYRVSMVNESHGHQLIATFKVREQAEIAKAEAIREYAREAMRGVIYG